MKIINPTCAKIDQNLSSHYCYIIKRRKNIIHICTDICKSRRRFLELSSRSDHKLGFYKLVKSESGYANAGKNYCLKLNVVTHKGIFVLMIY